MNLLHYRIHSNNSLSALLSNTRRRSATKLFIRSLSQTSPKQFRPTSSSSEPQPPAKPRNVTRRKVTLEPGEVLPEVPFGELPPIDMWRKYFRFDKSSVHRCMVRKPETAALLADIFVPEGSKDKIIIEASPGPGQLTRALLNLPKERIKKIIVLEPAKSFFEYVEPLEKLDPRVKVYQQHGMDWEVYTSLRDEGALDDVTQADWNQVHPQLQFIMHMTSWVDGEQLLSQFFRCIPDRQWLFQYGRVPLDLILPTRMWERINAGEGSVARCKLSVIAQTTSSLTECAPAEALQPYAEHFHPESAYVMTSKKGDKRKYLQPRRLGTPHMAIRALPLQDLKIPKGELHTWDYLLRKIFVQKATPLEVCLKSNALGPGSSNLIPKLPAQTLKKTPRDLSLDEWDIIVQEFKNWPFKPEDLGIESFFEITLRSR